MREDYDDRRLRVDDGRRQEDNSKHDRKTSGRRRKTYGKSTKVCEGSRSCHAQTGSTPSTSASGPCGNLPWRMRLPQLFVAVIYFVAGSHRWATSSAKAWVAQNQPTPAKETSEICAGGPAPLSLPRQTGADFAPSSQGGPADCTHGSKLSCPP